WRASWQEMLDIDHFMHRQHLPEQRGDYPRLFRHRGVRLGTLDVGSLQDALCVAQPKLITNRRHVAGYSTIPKGNQYLRPFPNLLNNFEIIFIANRAL